MTFNPKGCDYHDDGLENALARRRISDWQCFIIYKLEVLVSYTSSKCISDLSLTELFYNCSLTLSLLKRKQVQRPWRMPCAKLGT